MKENTMKWILAFWLYLFPFITSWGTDSTAIIPGTYTVPSEEKIFILAQGLLPTQSVVPPLNTKYMRPGSSHVSNVPGCNTYNSSDYSLTCPIGPAGGCPSGTTPSVAVSFAGANPNDGSGGANSIQIEYTFSTTTGGVPIAGSNYQLVFSDAYVNELTVNGSIRVQWVIYCTKP
jgi:hypothetical protein